MPEHPTSKVAIPGPIKITLTAKEASETHLLLDVLLRNDVGQELGEDRVRRLRHTKEALEEALMKAGCKLNSQGWYSE